METKRNALNVYDLIIEITRRCNMACDHCLRGNAQDLDMDESILENLFSRINSISTLTFTGGEPSLRPDLILTSLRLAEKYNVQVDSVYIVTNGKAVPDLFLKACRDWDAYCFTNQYRSKKYMLDCDALMQAIKNWTSPDEIVGCRVALSMDRFHEPISVESMARLMTLPRVLPDKYLSDDKYVLRTGRAAANSIGDLDPVKTKPWEYGPESKKLNIDENGCNYEIDELYVAADGMLLKHCNYSYEEQREHAVGRIRHAHDPEWPERLIREHEEKEEE